MGIVMRSRAAIVLLLLTLGGCAEATNNAPTIVREPKHRVSNSRWEVLQLPGQAVPVAGILDSTDKILLSVGCSKVAYLVLGPLNKGPHLKSPSIELLWDGSVEVAPLLRWVPSDGWDFGTAAGEPGFAPAISHLKEHDTLEVRIVDVGSGAPLRYRFAPAEADNAIDYVIDACGPKSS
jgi:hypothetical protein